MNSRCYICLGETKYQDALLCTNCFCQIQDEQWLSCARCGSLSCAGCDKLAEFTKVTSAYFYKNTIANILILSKEDNNKNAQKVFEELFFVPIKNILFEMIVRECYSYIMVSPLRKDRVFYGAWHPNLFYDEVLQYLYLNELKTHNKPQILYPYFTHNKKKQSLIPSKKREKNEKQNIQLNLSFENLNEADEKRKILLLDDVLTTGKTAQTCKKLCDTYFLDFDWHLFTILRAPQK